MAGFGLYVHVPFCRQRCRYCDFASRAVGRRVPAERYLDLIERELTLLAPLLPSAGPATLYVGGGTPSVLAPSAIARLGALVHRIWPVSFEEATVEANPESATPDWLAAARGAGFGRISFGAQSFHARELGLLGRLHDVRAIRDAVGAARAAGFGSVALDLMYGLPGGSIRAWAASLTHALALAPEHLSCYALTVEAGTRFAAALAAGELRLPSDDAVSRQYERAVTFLAAAGYARYEISNFALPGAQALHNAHYWTRGPYLGLGPGAASFVDGVRWVNAPTFVQHGTRLAATPPALAATALVPPPWAASHERLDPRAAAGEEVMLRLRTAAGVDLAAVAARHGIALPDVWSTAAEELAAHGLIHRAGSIVRLQGRGWLLASSVAERLL